MKYILLLLLGCATPMPKTNLLIWKFDSIDQDICASTPGLNNLGIKRVITCTPEMSSVCSPNLAEYEEFIPYCSDELRDMLAVDSNELYQVLKDRAKNNTF